MSQHFDVSLKTIFQREGDGILRRLLFGGKVVDLLATEQPQASNRRADLVVRTEDGSLHHVEFQVQHETRFGLRMLEYYVYLVRAHDVHVAQTVLYLGREALRLERDYLSPSMDFRFEIVNLREFDAAPLLASEDWADNVLALLAAGDPGKALDVVLPRVRAMQEEEERNWAASTLMMLSGIIGIEDRVIDRIKEGGMIDLMENKVLGPMIQERLDRGMELLREREREQGREQGRQEMLREQLTEKFGVLPGWAATRLAEGSIADLEIWAKRILKSTSLEDLLR